jgi:hypothetical protein
MCTGWYGYQGASLWALGVTPWGLPYLLFPLVVLLFLLIEALANFPGCLPEGMEPVFQHQPLDDNVVTLNVFDVLKLKLPHVTDHSLLGRRAARLALLFLYRVVPGCVELALVAITIGQMPTYIGYVRSIDKIWTLGQTISVTIWAPVVAEYLYLLVFGIEEGFRYRLVPPNRVTREQKTD